MAWRQYPWEVKEESYRSWPPASKRNDRGAGRQVARLCTAGWWMGIAIRPWVGGRPAAIAEMGKRGYDVHCDRCPHHRGGTRRLVTAAPFVFTPGCYTEK